MAAEKKTGPMVMSTAPKVSKPVARFNGSSAELTNLHNKSSLTPRILIHHDPAAEAEHLINAAEDHSSHETPCSIAPAKHDLDEHTEAVERDEHRGEWERRSVAVDGELDWTY